MPAHDQRVYAQSEKGMLARANARARYRAKRLAEGAPGMKYDSLTLAKIMNNWRA